MQNQAVDRIEKRKCASIISYFLLTGLCVFGREIILNYVNIPSIYFTVVRFLFPAVLFVSVFPYITKRSFYFFLVLEAIFISSYMYSYAQGYLITDNVLDYIVLTCVTAIPCCIMAMNIQDPKYFMDIFMKYSYIGSLVISIYLIKSIDTVSYSMSATYSLLLFTIVHISQAFKKNGRERILLILLFVFEIVLIFLRGSRGPLVCIGVFIIIKAFCDVRDNKKLVFLLIIGAMLLFVITFNFEKIINSLAVFLSNHNLTSRNMAILTSSKISFLDDSGRGYFQGITKDLIQKRPFTGYGASSDIYLVSAYPHNMLIEMIFDFGIIIGGILFLLFCISLLKILINSNRDFRDIGVIFIVTGFVMLMLSGTYLQNPNVFIMLGLGLNSMFRSKRTKIIGKKVQNGAEYA